MKFPLTERPFAPLRLSPEQRAVYERTAMALVLETVDEFDEYVHQQKRTMDPKLWKAVKTRENVTVYKKRELEDMVLPRAALPSSGSASSTSSASVSAITKWPLPKLLGVGSIVGDFDDVMYGVISPDVASMRVKTTYVDDELVDCQVLETIQPGTKEDPYRFVGIKWIAKSTASNNIVRPRDFVLIEATGIYVTERGEQYGYHAMHSVDLLQCPPLDRIGILRAKLSSCFLFKPVGNRTIEIFMKSFVELAGNVPDVVAIMSATNGLFASWKSVYCAEKKKLAWLLRRATRNGHRNRATTRTGTNTVRLSLATDSKGRECCALCTQRFSTFRSPTECALCRKVVCSRCETTRKLTFVDNKVTKVTVPFCKDCITSVSNMNAAEFARSEHVPQNPADFRSQSTPHSTRKPRTASGGCDGLLPSWRGLPSATSMDWGEFDAITGSEQSTALSTDTNFDDTPPRTISRTDALALSHVRPEPVAPSPRTPHDSKQQNELWQRMHQLRVQAEQAYQLTTHNNRVMAETIGNCRGKTPRSVGRK